MLPVGVLKTSIDSFRTGLEDLQAELEAGARCLERIQSDATTLDGRVVIRGRRLAELRALLALVDELKTSIREQRALLRSLRTSLDRVRRAIRDLRVK